MGYPYIRKTNIGHPQSARYFFIPISPLRCPSVHFWGVPTTIDKTDRVDISVAYSKPYKKIALKI